MTVQSQVEPDGDGIEPGKRLIRLDADKGISLAERLSNQLSRLAWRTPLHSLRLRGRYPLKLLGVPVDPIPGDRKIGQAMLEGRIVRGTEMVEIDTLDFANPGVSSGFADHLRSFAWLRDLAAAAPRETGAPIAELVAREFLAAHGSHVSASAWRADLCAKRLLFWAAYAPYILSSADIVYRSSVLNALARAARHLDREAEKATVGLPRIIAWSGVVTAGLVIPGGEPRVAHGEAGLARALAQATYGDGGLASRSPAGQLELVETLAQLRQVYAMRDQEPAEAVTRMLSLAVPALLGVTLGDGGLASWQGSGPIAAVRVSSVVGASGVRARPLRQARDWGYQRMSGGATTLVLDAAPPPVARLAAGGCASTLAFELSDGPHRLVVNCGGGSDSALPPDLARGLRTTAAHSTLIVADSNSTAIHADGTLGRGVTEVELDRQELDTGSRIEASHDGYARRHGFLHKRQLSLGGDGKELRGEDVLLPHGRKRRADAKAFAVRFHLAPRVETTPTADGMGALLRIADGALWQFRCRGGTLSQEDSIWIDPEGRPRRTTQLVVSGEAAAGGASISWLLKRAG
jgi:uncharacterized heparinase superfamily protein